MKTYKQKMPDLSNLPSSLSTQDIEINGGKVLFDHKVTLMPVDLEELPSDMRGNRPNTHGGR